jgi:uncharacterized membrane protein
MPKSRLEAFSDGVIAILITIMVLDLHVPHGTDLESLRPLLPVFLTYVMSFVFLGIYWNNHHHMLHAVDHIHGGNVLWANMHLLFWLSLIPFATGWMGENHFASLPTAIYGVVLLGAAIAYTILQAVIVGTHGGERLKAAVGSDLKGKLSLVAYIVAIPMAFVNQWISDALYVTVALIWLVPDTRIERIMAHRREAGD